ncbi:hypothetical protein [Algoriphagus antarcticus]|uniref:Uncharacterized protein n=1 Tax=Algoriphagus antarcticus TaxID=238540 RepID=A0A3E0EA25_9BACT|nr:hypothetical protein [Algoriphagus antarcticus]REG94500.1 hypothetical protein C8N25_101330 [Algoriphagus antarcticus]
MITIDEPAILIRINPGYSSSMSANVLYECTRSKWKVNPERALKAHYSFAVFKGVIVEVYEISNWIPAPALPIDPNYSEKSKINLREGLSGRYEFEGKLASKEIRDKYINQSVHHYFKQGNSNPINYVNI